MQSKKLTILLFILLLISISFSCRSKKKEAIDIHPHVVNSQADSLYKQALALMQSSHDVDSTRKCISILDAALLIDSLNPDYYGIKAKLLSEMGELDSALRIQTIALERKAITGEYLFQLGLFQAAKEMNEQAHESFRKSKLYLDAVLEQYPDSFGAFILAEAANALYLKEDSFFCNNIEEIRKRFSNRLLDLEMTRRIKPHSLIKQIKEIQIDKEYKIDFDVDSLVRETLKNE